VTEYPITVLGTQEVDPPAPIGLPIDPALVRQSLDVEQIRQSILGRV
jgi:hypothetical protein